MPGLVEEIQRDAIDDRIPVSTLLRKVKLAAAKLQLPFVETWVECELTGYGEIEIPDYRRFRGIPKAHNPVRGWIDIQAPEQLYNEIAKASTGQAIAVIERILAEPDGNIVVPMDRGLVDLLNDGTPYPFARMAVHLGRAEIAGIIDYVRNSILNWAIELEKSGVMGEGISFTQAEKSAAQQNITIRNFTGFIGAGNTVSKIVGGDLNG